MKDNITAAHCIKRRHSQVELSPTDVNVRLGAFNLTVENEEGSVQRNVSTIYVNPEWRQNSDKFDADVAILVLSENVTFSRYIQPICVPADDVVIEGAVIDVKGIVVGWGIAENQTHEEIPKKIVASAIANSICYRTDPSIIRPMSSRSFCGKGYDGNPTNGDSGGGFFVLSNSTWLQYGIVSALHTVDHSGNESFSIYTNLKSFKRFIAVKVSETGGELGVTTMKVSLSCTYSFTDDGRYTCQVNNFNIRFERNEIESIVGLHVAGNEDETVESIHFNDGSMFSLPDGLGKIFKNVKHLRIGNSNSSLGLTKIWRSSLTNFENLVELSVMRNSIELLDEACLWDLPNLEIFRLANNELQEIHENTFDKNERLVEVHITSNKLETLPREIFSRNNNLLIVSLRGNSLKTIDEHIFEANTVIMQVDLSGNRFEILSRNLFKLHFSLTTLLLDNNMLTTLDADMFEFNTKLTNLTLSSNRLTDLNKDLFRRLLLLQLIRLDRNPLESIPKTLFQNDSFLTFANLSGLNLKTIDEDLFERNSELELAILSSNKLEQVPKYLFKNNLKLEAVGLNENALATIDELLFEQNSALKEVGLGSNKLERLPTYLFKNNLQLKLIQLSNNSLRTIDELIFATNDRLEAVFFGLNKLEHLPAYLFKNNLILGRVDFHGNSLTTIDEHLFETNVKLTNVWLHQNQLQYLPRNLFKNNLLLENIDLDRNSLRMVDEHFFETNSKLTIVNLAVNKLEHLPKYLFKNNHLLEEVYLERNSLKIVDIDFAELTNVNYINLIGNSCINAFYDSSVDVKTRNNFRNLTEFQNWLNRECSVSKGSHFKHTLRIAPRVTILEV